MLVNVQQADQGQQTHGPPASPPPQGDKIPLSQDNVIDGWCAPMGGGSELDVPYNLLDEQELVGDPRAGDNKTPQTFWFPGYVKW